MSREKRIVITGVGILAPHVIGRKKFWDALKKGSSLTGPVTLFDTSEMAHKMAGELTGFNIHNIFKGKGLRNLTRGTEFALAASKFALEDASLPAPVPEKMADSCGVSFGSATGSMRSILDFDLQTLTGGPRSVNPPDFPNTAVNSIASHVSIRFNIKGFNTTLSTSLVSGLDAIFYGSMMIRNYDYDLVLAGATEELTLETYTGFAKLGCLARSEGKRYEEISCPYDKRRNGIIFSEGGCMLVLEELKHALRRKAKIYAEVKGCGFSFDPKVLRTSDIASGGAGEAMQKALDKSGCTVKQIDYIAGSANSTQRFDAIEASAIKSIFKDRAGEIPVSSIKSMIGESFSAGGALNAGAVIGALEGGFIPPTINYRVPDKECALNIVANKAVKKRLNNIMVNSFSHNGQNGSIIMGRYVE